MKLMLKVLDLKNFKGIKQFKLLLDKTEVKVYGANAAGKTTLADAFMWLLFDKDSQDRKDFEIKTLDGDNNPIHFLDHEVTGDFEIDGRTFTLSKRLKEKWVKKRGQAEQEFSGHETTYYIDGVPCKKAEYQKYVDEIIKEKTFKLLTNPLTFEAMKWQDKRKTLFEVCGTINDVSVPGYDKLQQHLNGKDVDEFKKSLAATKKKLKKDIEDIPPRIDELRRGIDESLDKEGALLKIAKKEQAIQDFEQQLEASEKAFEVVRDKQKLILSLERTKEEVIREHNKKLYGEQGKLKDQYAQLKSTLNSKQIEQDRLVKIIEIKKQDNVLLEVQVNEHRSEWQRIAEETFDEHKAICPTCGQDLPTDKVQELFVKYEREKAVRQERVVNLANSKKASIASNNNEIVRCTELFEGIAQEVVILHKSLADLEEKLAEPIEQTSCDTAEIDAQIDELKQALASFNQLDTSKIKEEIKIAQKDIALYNLTITKADNQEKTLERIKELEEQLKELQVSLADVEQQEILVEDFTKAKVDMLEENINSKFTTVKFKLFEEQINGGVVECCESLINGVPFSNANNAAKVAAGIDIINVLSNHYGFYAPIWLDNRESVTSIPDTYSQVINLIVSEKDKELRVE